MALTTYTAGEVLTAASLNNNFTFAAANPPGGMTFINSVSPSASATATITGCFTTTYDNYVIDYDLTMSAAAYVWMRLRIGGTDTTAANYNTGYEYSGVSTTASMTGFGGGTSQTKFQLAVGGGATRVRGRMWLYSPQIAAVTTGNYLHTMLDGGYTFKADGGMLYNASTQFDGFTFLHDSVQTMTGTIRVYGTANA